MILTIQHTSPIDALIALTKRLSTYENQQQMDSEEFFDQYSRGQLAESLPDVAGACSRRRSDEGVPGVRIG